MQKFTAVSVNMLQVNDDYDSPWKIAIDDYLPEFIQFYYPDIYDNIDWALGYEALDNEFQSIVRDADVGKHRADKLVQVTRLDGTKRFVYIHIEVQSQKDDDFEQRMFTYHYRIYDKYGQHPVSLAVLADDNERWLPTGYRVDSWGCRLQLDFRMVKLLAFETALASLQANTNPFAILTVAHILTKRTKKKPQDRYDAKFTLIRLLYERGWDKEEMLKFMSVIDWLMYLPAELAVKLREEVHALEEENRMRYMTSFEQLAMADGIQTGMKTGIQTGIQRGMQQGMLGLFMTMLMARFPHLDLQDYKDKIYSAAEAQLNRYSLRLFTAQTPEEVFAEDDDAS